MKQNIPAEHTPAEHTPAEHTPAEHTPNFSFRIKLIIIELIEFTLRVLLVTAINLLMLLAGYVIGSGIWQI